MTRLGGAAAGGGACALTVALAGDGGGYGAPAWDRGLVALASLLLVGALLGSLERPGPRGAAFLGALGCLTAWTASSWLWSESPPRALVEAQRAALYLAAAGAVVLACRRVPVVWIAAGVAAASTVVACWNLVLRARGAGPELGASADPVGYANGLALLCVVGILLLPMLPRRCLAAAAPLAADLVLQHSTGALAALGAGLLVWLAVARPRLRPALAVVALAGAVAAPFALAGHYRADYWRVALREARADPVLGSGAGTFSNWWARERPAPQSTLEAHSLYLETLAELGPLGLALLLLALAVPLAVAVRFGHASLAAALTAYDVAVAVDFHWELAGVTAPVVMLAAAAVAAPGSARAARRRATVPAFVVLAAAAVLAYAGTAHLAAAEDALRHGDTRRAAAEARAALRYAPFSADAWRALGDAESSAAAYRRAIELDRNDWSLWVRLAAITTGEPHRRAVREAMRLDPLLNGR